MAKKTKTAVSPKVPKTKKVASQNTPVNSPARSKKAASADTPSKSPARAKASAKPKKAVAEKAVAEKAEKEFGYVSKSQVAQAVLELKKYFQRQEENKEEQKSSLFDDEDDDESKHLIVEVELKKYYTSKGEFKQKSIRLTKPYRKENEALKTCLFIRDSLITNDEQLEEVENAKIPTLLKILTLTELKTVYKTFEKRRELYQEYDLFVVDDAILSSMPATLGKTFYNNDITKFPVCIKVASTKNTKKLSLQTLKNQIDNTLSSTQFLPPAGTKIELPIGAASKAFTDEELISNVGDVVKFFQPEQLVTIGLRSKDSPVLPLFYTEKLYSDEDIAENATEEKEDEVEDDVLTKALLELGDEESVKKTLGNKLRQKKKKKSASKGVSKP